MTSVDPAEKQSLPKGRIWRELVGWSCLVIGVLGIILPIIPGIPFLVVGLAALSTEYRWVRSLLVWMKRKLGRYWPRQIKIPRVRRKVSRRNDQAL